MYVKGASMRLKWIISGLVVAGLLVFSFQNCGESQFSDSSSTEVKAANFSEDQLLELLEEAKKKIAALGDISDTDHKDEAQALAARLTTSRQKILDLLAQEHSTGSSEVLSEVDMLVFLMSEAGDRLIIVDLDALKDEVAENRRRIGNLETELADFKKIVTDRLDQVDRLIANLETRQNDLEVVVNQLRTDTEVALLALQNSIQELQNYTKQEIANLYQLNNQLTQEILAQKEALDKLFKSNKEVADLQGRMCLIGKDGNVSDSRPACDGMDLENTSCCLTVEVVDCTTLFPAEEMSAARAQCEIILTAIKNHDAQLAAIREMDDKQNKIIEGLIKDVKDLQAQTAVLKEGQSLLAADLKNLSSQVDAIDARLLIVEFKAARAEAAASISERIDLTKAWIVQRERDVRRRYCHANFFQGRKMFDYEAQRHNWNYCHHKISVLRQAMVSLQNISGFTHGIESLNVDGKCSATINGKNAESLSLAELTRPAIFRQVNELCNAGPALVKSRLLNAVKALATIAPDFRTIDYMAQKAKIAQLIFFGKAAVNLSQSEINYYTNVNPMAPRNKNTAFGRVEGLFKNKYVAHILRDSSGRFPRDAKAIAKARIPSSHAVYSHAEISSAANSYLKTLKASEITCSNCSWGVRGRTNAGGVVTGVLVNGHRVSYPKDVERGLCPVQNDIVVLKNKDGAYYSYRINYDLAGREIVRPVIWGGNHVKFAANSTNFNKGLTRPARFWNSRHIYKNGLPNMDLHGRLVLNVSRPYGKVYTGKGHCLHFSLAAPLKQGEWVSSNPNTRLLYRFLSGYNASSTGYLAKTCRNNMGSKSKVRTAALTVEEHHRMRIADSAGISAATFSKRNQIKNSNTQLGSKYWVTKRRGLNYGSKNYPSETVSAKNPFFGPATTSTMAVRAWRRGEVGDRIVKQECTPNE